MDGIIDWVKNNWATTGIVFLASHTFLKAIRDAIDKTPASDDNWFERLVSIIGKVASYLFVGQRPNK